GFDHPSLLNGPATPACKFVASFEVAAWSTMATNNCSFCDHANPTDAKFCNECGAGLGLRPCAQCEAINDISATYCHHCGALLGVPAATAVAGAAQAEGTPAEKTPAPTRPAEPIAQLTGAPA